MDTGERIQTARKLRGMTQIELGESMGFRYKNAAERIRQYERSIRKPKESVVNQMAKVLNVNPKSISGPTGYEPDDVIRILMDLETEGYDINICRREDQMIVTISHAALNQPLEEWERIRTLRRLEKLTEKQYMTWKFEWIIIS